MYLFIHVYTNSYIIIVELRKVLLSDCSLGPFTAALRDKFYVVNNGFKQAEQQHQSASGLLAMLVDGLDSLEAGEVFEQFCMLM